MRHYPKNSPRAAARILALTLLADGHCSRSELDALQRAEVARQLGLDAVTLQDLLREVAEDLVATGAGLWHAGGSLDESVIASALAEIDDPAMQRRVLDLCGEVSRADAHLSDGEQAVLSAAAARWRTGSCIPS